MLDFLSPRKLLTQLTLGAGLVAAQLQTISNFGPTYDTRLVMQAYVPSNLPANPAVMVAVSDKNNKIPYDAPANTDLSFTLVVALDRVISSRPSTSLSLTLAESSSFSLPRLRTLTAGMSPAPRPSSTVARATARSLSAWSTMPSTRGRPTVTRSLSLVPAPGA